MPKIPTQFSLEPILTGEDFVENFKDWINYGQSVGLLREYEPRAPEKEQVHPQSPKRYLYRIFLNELKRDGQKYELLEDDISQSFNRAFPAEVRLTFNLDQRIATAGNVAYLCFPGFVREMMLKMWLKTWAGKKHEPIPKKDFYWQLWKLFFFEFCRQEIITDPDIRKPLFEEFWHSFKHSPQKKAD